MIKKSRLYNLVKDIVLINPLNNNECSKRCGFWSEEHISELLTKEQECNVFVTEPWCNFFKKDVLNERCKECIEVFL